MVSINKIKLPVIDELFFPANFSITAIRQIAFMCLSSTHQVGRDTFLLGLGVFK